MRRIPMTKKIVLLAITCMLFFGAAPSQAAYMELGPLPDIAPGVPGEMTFGIYLTDSGALPNIDLFNIALGISDVPGLQLSPAEGWNVLDNTYIFNGNSLVYTWTNTGGDLSQFAAMDVTASGVGADIADGNLLSLVTLSYPALEPGILPFSLMDGMNFVQSDAASNLIFEDIVFDPATKTSITVTPIPATFWLLGSFILGLCGLNRHKKKHRS